MRPWLFASTATGGVVLAFVLFWESMDLTKGLSILVALGMLVVFSVWQFFYSLAWEKRRHNEDK